MMMMMMECNTARDAPGKLETRVAVAVPWQKSPVCVAGGGGVAGDLVVIVISHVFVASFGVEKMQIPMAATLAATLAATWNRPKASSSPASSHEDGG